MRKTVLPQILIIILVVAACAGWTAYRYATDLEEIKIEVNKDGKTERQTIRRKQVPINLGLDLKGGVHMVLECLPPSDNELLTPEQVSGVMKVMEARLDPKGVREIALQKQGQKWVSIDIPGENDPDRVRKLVDRTALLQFVHVGNDNLAKGDRIDDEILKKKCPEHYGPNEHCLVMTGGELKKAFADFDGTGLPSVGFELKKEGAEVFGNHTKAHVDQILAIAMDGVVISAPNIQSAIFGGRGQITGQFSREEITDLVDWLNSGALPVPVRVAEVRAISPTLGRDSLQKSLIAGVCGLAIVMFFMLIIYRLPGAIANFALILYIIITFGIMSMLNATLTLPGIAGFIMSIGMAVDANIIIFERLKEELRWGKTLKAGVEAGFNRAFTAILDSNVTTIIAGAVLYAFGSGPIRGFAVTLCLGVAVSMFSAITISRTLLMLFVDGKSFQNHSMYGVKSAKSESSAISG